MGPTGEKSNTCPSGRARATSAVPIVPPAPVTLRTTTGWPSAAPISFCIMRATMSVGPPAAKFTTIWICARAGSAQAIRTAASVAMALDMLFPPPACRRRLCDAG